MNGGGAQAHHLLILLLGALLFLGAACADDGALQDLKEIAKTYAIEVVTDDPVFPVKTRHGTIDGKGADATALQAYARLFATEFKLYPTDLVRRARLKRVVLCSELAFAGQRRNAIPDYQHDALYLDVRRGTHSKPYVRKVIHHEFFHVIDLRDDGSVYRDERWAALNPADFKYGTGGRLAQDLSETSVFTTKYPGFLNHYSTTGVEEDKAEVFANLVVCGAYVEDRAKNDPVLKAKVQRMKELLADFCPAMDGKFWEGARAAKRTDEGPF